MCGIFLSLDRKAYQSPSPEIQDLLRQRGPDSQQRLAFNVPTRPLHAQKRQDSPFGNAFAAEVLPSSYITCMSSVLSLRGDNVVKQPISPQTEQADPPDLSFLCWNGEAWSFGGTSIRGNDSSHVFDVLSYVSSQSTEHVAETSESAVSEALAAYAGPFAFVFYDHPSRRVYLGRDFLGRRSLLHKPTANGGLLISSIPDDEDGWQEIESDGVYWVDLDHAGECDSFILQKTPYQFGDSTSRSSRSSSPCELELPTDIPSIETESRHRLEASSDTVDSLHRLLHQALISRLSNIPAMPKLLTCRDTPPARVAILFSGGLDCTLLARLTHDVLPSTEPVDLLNVAFENPRVHANTILAGGSPFEQCPDRQTCRSSEQELRAACPGRHWRLICINVTYKEFVAHREDVISLISPHNTEMDLSIASALYFAARGKGILSNGNSYETHAKVLLSGLGADELFAGYTRHATAYARGGLSALQEELALDISRLGKRNLGRDDRVISHWAKEARYPFLDEQLVSWALSASVYEKCGFGQPAVAASNGTALDPAKMGLRCLAKKLSMPSVANEKKRAIQFGARTAKMEAKKTKGTYLLTTKA